MRTLQIFNSFRARLVLLLVVLLGLTLSVQYYVNLQSVKRNAHMLVAQEQAIMAGVALGVNSISSAKYLDEIRSSVREPLLDEPNGRVRNVLVVDSDGNVLDSLSKDYAPKKNADGTNSYWRITNITLPPLRSAVELPDEGGQLPAWLTARAPTADEAGAFYFPVGTQQGRLYVIVVLGSAKSLTSLLERQASRSAQYTLLLLLATTLVTGLFVWRFTRPVKRLSVAAQRVATGDFNVRVPTDRRDEMGALAVAFNDMTAQLGSLRDVEAKLHQVEKAAVVGRLAAAIAHEIRNPLNYINLTLDHLRSSYAPADAAKRETFERLADQLKQEVQRINRHITDFLKYSRPSALELEPLDLREQAEDALRVIAGQAAERGVETGLKQEGQLPPVVADKDSLRSVFTNLLINSLEAIDGAGGTVEIKLSSETTDSARVEITDTGKGIAPEDIAKVFEPYYSTKETGTGLGLAIVKKAIDDHGGSISVSSKKGSGTTFVIILPVKQRNEGVEKGMNAWK
ncbi:MAG TPA: ATP-binding protein [Pyrinomonadaceae bacterium]|jgi:signal transduction histidine kinase|nr:ATP-binding protein [Pyrinomonadaceae bacterium]